MRWNARLTRWPKDGIPANPEAWLLTVARNRMRDVWKSHAYRMTDAARPKSMTAQPKSTTCPRYPTGGWS